MMTNKARRGRKNKQSVGCAVLLLCMTPLQVWATEEAAYRHLEYLQERRCKNNPSNHCAYGSVDIDSYVATARENMRSTFQELSDADFEEVLARFEDELRSRDQSLSTKYDFFGQGALYKSLYDALATAAATHGIVLTHKPALGSLVENRINAAAIRVPSSSHKIIALNSHVFSLANEVSKTVSETMFFRLPDGSVSQDTSYEPADFDAFLDQAPVFPEYFARLMIEFLGYGGTQHIFPSVASPITNGLRDGMELFIVAHEKTHILKDHQGDIVAMLSDAEAEAFRWSWAQEVQADIGGAELLYEVVDQGLWHTSHDIEHELIARGGIYFFEVYSMLEEAAATAAGVDPTCLAPSEDETAAFGEIVTAIDDAGVLLAANPMTLASLPQVDVMSSHPNARLRQILQRELFDDRYDPATRDPVANALYSVVQARSRHLFARALDQIEIFVDQLDATNPEAAVEFRSQALRYIPHCLEE